MYLCPLQKANPIIPIWFCLEHVFFCHCFPTCDGHMYRDKFKCTSWIYKNLSVLCLEKCTLQGTNILSHRKRNIFLKSALGKRYVRSRGGYFFTTYLFVFFGPKLQDDYIDCGQWNLPYEPKLYVWCSVMFRCLFFGAFKWLGIYRHLSHSFHTSNTDSQEFGCLCWVL